MYNIASPSSVCWGSSSDGLVVSRGKARRKPLWAKKEGRRERARKRSKP